ncbi:hypothetical protein N5P37_004969, partial [Trichoderma harzianum]
QSGQTCSPSIQSIFHRNAKEWGPVLSQQKALYALREADVAFAEERPVAAVRPAAWIGSAVKSVKIKCHLIISPCVRPAR